MLVIGIAHTSNTFIFMDSMKLLKIKLV